MFRLEDWVRPRVAARMALCCDRKRCVCSCEAGTFMVVFSSIVFRAFFLRFLNLNIVDNKLHKTPKTKRDENKSNSWRVLNRVTVF
ncbi:hypothetical protein M5D96_002792, partial [Drosophila gunungcola]